MNLRAVLGCFVCLYRVSHIELDFIKLALTDRKNGTKLLFENGFGILRLGIFDIHTYLVFKKITSAGLNYSDRKVAKI